MGILTSPPSITSSLEPGTFVTLDINWQPNYMVHHSSMRAQKMGEIEK